jgi:ATP-dependent DNA helicase DinG
MMTESQIALFMDNPEWDKIIPSFQADKKSRILPSHEDCSSIDIEDVTMHLLPGGTLGIGISDYESRPGQLDVLRAVGTAFNSRKHLMIEAGTGVGKSLAYLIPSVHWAYLNDTPVVVSTATRNLQDQLLNHDIPNAILTLNSRALEEKPFKVAILKGRSNYLCLRELSEVNHDGIYSLDNAQIDEFAILIEWLQKTDSGDLDLFEAEVAKRFGDEAKATLRPKLSCPPEECAGRRCPFYSKCFVNKARILAKQADLIVTNHALVLTEANNPGSELLPAYGRIVFDEAHNLPDIATDVFTFEFSKKTLSEILGRVERKANRGRRGLRSRGILSSIQRQLDKGNIRDNVALATIIENLNKVRVALGFAATSGDALLDSCTTFFNSNPSEETVRYRTIPNPNAPNDAEKRIRQHAVNGAFESYRENECDENVLRRSANEFEGFIARLMEGLYKLREALILADSVNLISLFSDITTQLVTLTGELRDYLLNVKFILQASDEEHVFWAQRSMGKNRRLMRTSSQIELFAAPLFVAERMNSICYKIKDSVVMCSATLRVGDKFNYLAHRMGMDLTEPERLNCLVASSPFDFNKQSLVMSAGFLPEPDDPMYIESLAGLIARLADVSRGRMLVLFTAYEMMNGVAEKVRRDFDCLGIRLLVQGQSVSRNAMVQLLKTSTPDKPTVLFGAQSFWEGVDIPGDALSCVVLARIPFPQIKEPINAARMEYLRVQGKSDFREYMIPEAQIRFRQGVGRLVRKKTDEGVIVLADSRIATKNYGGSFKKSVPSSVHVVKERDELISRAKEFFNKETEGVL